MSPMKQEIRFCKSADGTGIAFALSGSGMPLVRAQQWVTHLEHDAHSPVWLPILTELSRRFRVVRYDQRGVGLSDADPETISFEAWVADLEAVVEAAGVERFTLLGASQGSAMAVAYAARHPERVEKLVVLGGYARGWNRRNSASDVLERAATQVRLIELGWGAEEGSFRQVFTSGFMPEASLDQQKSFNQMMRTCTSAETAARIFRTFGEIDVQDEARRISCPCLVAHGRGDLRVPFEEGRLLASLIPGARFVPLESANHILIQDEPAMKTFMDALDAFAGPGGAAGFPQLTAREREVLELMAQGLDNAQIAARLDLSEKTVRNHITRIFDKIEVENRSQAIVAARKAGLGAEAESD
jgi:pimeloyl-ACP methyl ester carboxylesterase/DNA-binding CsgD family transcriptional regulator